MEEFDLPLSGSFIVIEGIDGSGKTTFAKGLVDMFNSKGHKALYAREPGGSRYGELLRSLLLNSSIPTMATMFGMLSSRVDIFEKLIEPALNDGITVVCDRYFPSTYVYNIDHGSALEEPQSKMFFSIVSSGLFYSPDYTILLTCDPEVAWSRVNSREAAPSRFESDSSVLKRRQELYFKYFDHLEMSPDEVLDTTHKFPDVHDIIYW